MAQNWGRGQLSAYSHLRGTWCKPMGLGGHCGSWEVLIHWRHRASTSYLKWKMGAPAYVFSIIPMGKKLHFPCRIQIVCVTAELLAVPFHLLEKLTRIRLGRERSECSRCSFSMCMHSCRERLSSPRADTRATSSGLKMRDNLPVWRHHRQLVLLLCGVNLAPMLELLHIHRAK